MLLIDDRLNISQKYIFLVWTERTMLSENGDVIKNRHERVPDHSTVSIQNGGRTLPCEFSLDRNDFQSFDALSSAFNPAEASLRFHKKETRYFKASDLASLRKSEDKTTLSKPALQLLSASFRRKISKNSKPQQHPTKKNQEWCQFRGPRY